MASIEGLGMNEVQTGASSALFGSWRHTSVSRGLGEFHGRRPVLVTAKDGAGIEIASRMPLDAPVNADNHRYMTAKAERAGHQFDDLTASLTDRS